MPCACKIARAPSREIPTPYRERWGRQCFAAERFPTALQQVKYIALRVSLNGKFLGVDLRFILLLRKPEYPLDSKGVVDAEGVLLSPALCSDLLGIPSLGWAAQPLIYAYVI